MASGIGWTSLRNAGHKAIKLMGDAKTCKLVSRTSTPNVLGDPTITDTQYDITCCFARFRQKDIDQGTQVEAEDRVLYLSAVDCRANSVTPDKGDKIIDGDDTFEIVFMQPNKPGSQEIWYVAKVRR